jgi:hypothetical protein
VSILPRISILADDSLRNIPSAPDSEAFTECDVTDCGEPIRADGTHYCEEHAPCTVCGAIGPCNSKSCNWSDR